MKKVTLLVSILFVFSAFSNSLNGQANLQSMFIYNFIKLIDWPAPYKTGDFVIGVYGNGAITPELQKIAANKTAGAQNIKVVSYNSHGAISKCNILFIPAAYQGQIATISATLSGKSTLIITESEGMINHGSGINFIIREGKMKFELNRSKIEASSMKVSSQLANLAFLVI